MDESKENAKKQAEILVFEPVIRAIDSASADELAELAAIKDTLVDVSNALTASNKTVSAIRKESGKQNAQKNNRSSRMNTDDSSIQITRIARSQNKSSEPNKPDLKETKQEPRKSNSVFSEGKSANVIKYSSNKDSNRSLESGKQERKNSATPKNAQTQFKNNKPDSIPSLNRENKSVDSDKSENEKSESTDSTLKESVVSNNSEQKKLNQSQKELNSEFKGFFRDARGRLRREDGRYASKDERRRYADSQKANEQAEERRKAGGESDADGKKEKSILQRIAGFLQEKDKSDVTENEAVDAAGTTVGNSYWKAAVESYKAAASAKELAGEKLDGINGWLDKRKKKKANPQDSEPEKAAPQIKSANNTPAINSASPLTTRAGRSAKVGQKSAMAGSLAAKERANAKLGVKRTQEQTQVLRDNHAELLSEVQEISKAANKKNQTKGIFGAIGAAAGNAMEIAMGLIGAKAAGKLKDVVGGVFGRKKKGKDAPETDGTRRKKTRATGKTRTRRMPDLSSVADCACDTGGGYDADMGGRDKKTRRTRKAKGGRRVRGRKGRMPRPTGAPGAPKVTPGTPTPKPGAPTPKPGAPTPTPKPGTPTPKPVPKAPAGIAGAAEAAQSTGTAAKAATRGAMATPKAAATVGGKVLRGGARVAGAGMRAIPVVGQLATIGMAGMSYMDEEGQRAAFGLNEGQEVGVQKKLSYAATDALSMGGFLFDAANAVGTGLRSIGLEEVGKKLESIDTATASQAVDNGVTNLTEQVGGLFDNIGDKVRYFARWADAKVTGKAMFSEYPGDGTLAATKDRDSADKRLRQYDPIFESMGKKYNIDPAFLKAVAKQESGGRMDARSKRGAEGLMQLLPSTAAELGVKNIRDPAQNIEGGAKYLSQLSKRYNGDPEKMLAAYNYGMGNLDRTMEKRGTRNYAGLAAHMPAETRKYVPTIMRQTHQYKNDQAVYARENPERPAKTQEAPKATAQAVQVRADAAVPNVVPVTKDLSSTKAGKIAQGNDDSPEVIAKTDPELIRKMEKGFDKLATALTPPKQGTKAGTNNPAPRPKVPTGFDDPEMAGYVRDDY